MGVRRGAVVAVLATVLALTACSPGADPRPGPAPGPDAAGALCAAAFPEGTVVGAYATTVGEVRGRGAGPGLRPAATAWPGRPGTDAAAWCYVDGTGPSRVAAAAAAGAEPVVFARGDFTPAPDGPRVP